MNITKEEILKLARMSRIEIHEHEIAPLQEQLSTVLSYAERVKEAVGEHDEPSNKQVNVVREDIVIPQDAQVILAQAPEHEDNYFVVPVILESN